MSEEASDRNEKFADYLSAEKYRTEAKYLQAIDLFQKILEKDPNEIGVRVVLADLQAKAGDNAKALENYYLAATTYHVQGQRQRVQEVLERMARVDAEGKSLLLKKLRRLISAAPSVWDKPRLGPAQIDEDGVSISLDAPLFRDLGPQARARLVEKMAVMNVREGSIMFREGDPGTSLYVIASGRVRLTFRTREAEGGAGEERLFAELGPGEFFGEFAFLTGTARQFTARVSQDGRIFQLPKASLEEVQRAYPPLGQTLTRFYKERVLDRVLAGSTLFGGLPAERRHAIVDRFVMESFPAGSVIIAQGSTGDMLYLIRQGEVRVTAMGPSGDEVFLTNLHPNDFFGEFSFLTGRPRSASVVATSDAELLSVSRAALEPMLAQSPEVVQAMRKAYFERMADNLHKLASTS